jgi:hypothetical protein
MARAKSRGSVSNVDCSHLSECTNYVHRKLLIRLYVARAAKVDHSDHWFVEKPSIDRRVVLKNRGN